MSEQSPANGPVVLGWNPLQRRRTRSGPFCDALTLGGRTGDDPHGRLSAYCAFAGIEDVDGHLVCRLHVGRALRRGWREATPEDTAYADELVAEWRRRGLAS